MHGYKMKTKAKEMDVDFIGGQGPLTVEEEKAIRDFFRQRKAVTKKNRITKDSASQNEQKFQPDLLRPAEVIPAIEASAGLV